MFTVQSVQGDGSADGKEATDAERTGTLQFNVRADNLSFYTELMALLGWQTLYTGEGMLGVAGRNGASLWFVGQVKDVTNDYDGPGLNHLATDVDSGADVDSATAYLREHGIAPRFDTPRHRLDFAAGPDQTYYQVMFETPDRLLLEVVYTGPLSA